MASLDMDLLTLQNAAAIVLRNIVLNSEAASTDAGFARSVTNLVCDSFDFNDQFRGFTNGDGDYLSKSLRPLSELLGAL